MLSALIHPNIITIHNFGELDDGSLFWAMELVEGADLRTTLLAGPQPLLRVLNLSYQCADALAFAHAHGVVHRDFRPDNVMVSSLMGRDHVKVLDFGIARMCNASGITEPGMVVGTPAYLGPEQCRGKLATASSDQYALGLTMYGMLLGREAISAESPEDYMLWHLRTTLPPPSAGCSTEGVAILDPIVMRMLQKDPAERYASMQEVQRAIAQVTSELVSASA